MAYTLKTTGIATKLISCLGVDEDGATVKDFVTGATGTYNASIATPRTGVGAWKGVVRSWFKTDQGVDQFAPRGWVWGAPIPSAPMGAAGNGIVSLVFADSMDAASTGIFWLTADNNQGMRRSVTGKLEVMCGNNLRGSGTTTLAAATKLAFGFRQKYNETSPFYFGLESGTLAEDGTYAEGGFASTSNISEFGGHTGHGSAPGKYYLDLRFSAAILPTTAELQALHLDPFGTLFDAPAAAFTVNGSIVATLTPNGSIIVSTGTRFVTETLVSRAGGAQASLSNLSWYWADTFGGPVVASGAVEITDTSGVIVVEIAGTALTPGQFGYLALEAASGERRIYRLPVQ